MPSSKTTVSCRMGSSLCSIFATTPVLCPEQAVLADQKAVGMTYVPNSEKLGVHLDSATSAQNAFQARQAAWGFCPLPVQDHRRAICSCPAMCPGKITLFCQQQCPDIKLKILAQKAHALVR